MTRHLLVALGLFLAVASTRAGDEPDKTPVSHAGRPLRAWLDDLHDSDLLIREEALEVLGLLGPKARTAAPELKKLLKSDNRNLRTRAALALWRVTGEPRSVVGVLTDSLPGADTAVRREALTALDQMGPAGAPAASVVVDLLDDSDFTLRTQAGTALRGMGRAALPSLLKALQSKQVRLRRNAIGQLVNNMFSVVGQEEVPALRARLKDEDARVRIEAGRLLWTIGATDPPVIAALGEGAAFNDPVVRSHVLTALANSSARPKTLVPLLERAMKNADLNTRIQAARILFEVEKKPRRVLPLYLEALRSSNSSDWGLGLSALAEVGPGAKEALPRLLELLRLPNFYHYQLREVLVRIGPDGIPSLVALLKEPAASGRSAYNSPQEVAVWVLGQLGGKAATAVVPLLGDRDAKVRMQAVRVLTAIGPQAKDAVPRLVERIDDTSLPVRNQTLAALGSIGPDARAAVPKLLELAKGTNPALRAPSMEALMRLRPDPKETVPVALDALKDTTSSSVRGAALELLQAVDPDHKDLLEKAQELLEDRVARTQALAVLGRMGDRAAKAVPAVVKLLDDPNDPVRSQAAVTLSQIGPAAREAVPALLEQLERPDASLQNNALAALKNIGAEAKVAVPKLVEFVRRSKSWSVGNAFLLLGEYGPKAAAADPALLAILRDPSYLPFMRANAGLALAQVDPARAKKEALSDLRALMQADRSNMTAPQAILLANPDDREALAVLDAGLTNTYHYTRSSAADAVGQLGPRAKRFVPVLKRLLDDPHYHTRGRAALALWRVSGDAGDALPTLKVLLRYKGQSYARAFAANLLGEMGAKAKPAWSDLLAARKDSDSYVRSQVDAALKKVDPRAAAKAGVP